MASFATFGNDLFTGKRSFGIVGRRKLWYAVSAALILVSLAGLFGRGINFGIEFRGGSELRVSGVSQMQDYEMRAEEVVTDTTETDTVNVTQLGSDSVRIQTDTLGDGSEEATAEVRAALADEFTVDRGNVTSSFIGPSWGDTVTEQAIYALIVFLCLLTVVLALYFRTWKMAAAALMALAHDVVFTVGIYALAGFEVSPASMIGFLTILGYSIYDTVVVFDKVRENTAAAKSSGRLSYAQSANLAVNQTLVRSINTSVVALLPVGAILVVGSTLIGPGTLLDLALALFIGIAVGTFSSVFIATPVLVHMRQNEDDVRRLDKRARTYQERHATGEPLVERAPGVEAGETSPGDREPGAQPVAAASPAADDRGLHPYARTGPRNQPKRRPKSRR